MVEARATVVNGGWSRWWKKPSGIKGRLMQFFVTFRERERAHVRERALRVS
jgi:hypothetical protein